MRNTDVKLQCVQKGPRELVQILTPSLLRRPPNLCWVKRGESVLSTFFSTRDSAAAGSQVLKPGPGLPLTNALGQGGAS